MSKLRGTAVLLAAVAVTAAVPAGAGAATVSCKAGHFYLVDNETYTEVSQLRAIGLPAKTSDYASPCLVAEAVAARVQQRHGKTGRIRVHGARWDGGWWTVTHRTDDLAYDRYTAKKGSQRVTFVYGL
jgi:hypothetical protein